MSMYMHLKLIRIGHSLTQDTAILNAILMISAGVIMLQTTRVTNLRASTLPNRYWESALHSGIRIRRT